jgi:alpha-glucoside transport system ATP-binding protein
VAQFIGSPAMNLLPGEIVGTGKETRIDLHHGHDAVADVETQEAEKGWSVNVGVRPEDFRIAEEGDHVFFEGTVDYVEAIGEVTLLYFKTQGDDADPIIAKLPGIHDDLRGQTVKLTAAAHKVQIFHDGLSLRTR